MVHCSVPNGSDLLRGSRLNKPRFGWRVLRKVFVFAAVGAEPGARLTGRLVASGVEAVEWVTTRTACGVATVIRKRSIWPFGAHKPRSGSEHGSESEPTYRAAFQRGPFFTPPTESSSTESSARILSSRPPLMKLLTHEFIV